MLKKCLLKNVVAGMVFGTLGMVLSCSDNVGLGESVDTQAPTIEISYPPASAIIRGTFLFSGTWKDDKGVESVTASIMNTATKQTYPANEVKLGLNSWSVEVNNYSTENSDYINGWQLPDGKYEVSVYAMDKSGHRSGTASRTFEIDNTAPVTVLTSPGSTTSYTAYGSSFSVTGTIAEEHTVASLAVTIYDKDGNVLNENSEPYTETSVATAGGTSVSLLKFNQAVTETSVLDDGFSEENLRYRKVYGTNRNRGTEKYSCEIIVADNAKLYGEEQYKAFLEGETTNNTSGNETTTFYLNASVYETLLSSTKGYGLTVSELMTIINGTYVPSDYVFAESTTEARSANIAKGTLNSEKLKEVRELLFGEKSVAVDTAKDHLLFSLDPAVNPSYTVSGFALADTPNGTKNQTTTFIVSPGLDGTQFRPNTIAVYLLNCGEYNVETGFEASKYTKFLEDPAAYYKEHKDTTMFVTDFADKYTDSDTLSTLTATFKMPEIVADNYYIIGIAGHDLDDNALIPDGVFGFIGALSGTPPLITFTSPNNQAIIGNSADLTFTGEVVTTEVKLDKILLKVDVTDIDTNKQVGDGFEVTAQAGSANKLITWDENIEKDENSKYTYTWSFSLKDAPEYDKYKAEKGSDKMYMYTVTATSKDSSGGENTVSRTVSVDTLPPKVTISSVVPSVSENTDATSSEASVKYVNGEITVSVSIEEMNLKSASYTVFVGDTAVEDLTNVAIPSMQYKIKIPTTTLQDDKPINVVVTAIDRATGTLVTALDGTVGNVGSYSTTELNGGVPYHILQQTDYPVINTTNADMTIQSQEQIVAATNDKDAQSNNVFKPGDKLQATITDDDGIKEVTVKYRPFGSNVTLSVLESKYNASNNTLSSALPADYGMYELEVTATDVVGNLPTSVTKKTFVVAMDDGVPTFSDVQPANDSFFKDTMSVSGTITDASGEVKLRLKSGTNQGTSAKYAEAVTLTGTKDGIAFSDTISVPNDSQQYALVYEATDAYGQSKDYTIRYKVDKVAPDVKIPAVEGAAENAWFNSTSAFVSVYAQDNINGSGIAYIKAYVLKPSEVAEFDADKTTLAGIDLSSAGKNSEEQSENAGLTLYRGAISLTQGENVVKVVAKDNAGNPAGNNSFTVKVDTLPPAVSVQAIPAEYAIINATEKTQLTGGLSIEPTIVDTGSGAVKAILSTKNIVYTTSAAFETDFAAADTALKAETEAVTSENGWKPTLKIPQDKLVDGAYVYYVHALDKAGRTTISEPISFTVDTKAPTLVVNALTGNKTYTEKDVTGIDTTASPRTATYTIAGNWTDKDGSFAGSGTSELKYSIDGGVNWNAIAAETAAGVTINWTNAIDGVKEGFGNSIWFKATDVAGNETSVKKYEEIVFDFSAPEITLNDATKALPAQTKDAVTIAGTVQDVLALSQDKINIVVKKDNVAQTGIEPQITQTTTGKDKPYTFTLTIPVKDDHANDGSWTVTIDAKDDAGRDAAQQSVTVKIDTKKPVISNLDFTTGKGSKKDDVYHFNGSDIPRLTVTAADDGVGINTISYGIVSGAQTEWKDTLSLVELNDNNDKWASLQLESGSNYRADITKFNTLGDGTYTVFVCVKDNVGNIAYSDAFVVTNDKTAPELTESIDENKPIDKAKNLSFESTTFALTGTVTDTNLKTVTLERTEDDVKSTETLTVSLGKWTLSQAVPDDSNSHSYVYSITAKDYAGNETSILNRNVKIDRMQPVVSIEKPDSGIIRLKNGSCSFDGKATDDGGSELNAVYAILYTGTEPADPTPTTAEGLGYSTVSVNSNGAFTQKYYDKADDEYKLKVVAFDKAGNKNSDSVRVIVDSEVPESTLSVISGTLVKADNTSTTVATIEDNGTYIAKGAFTLKGSVTDKFGFNATDIQLLVGTTAKPFTAATQDFVWESKTSAFVWTYAQPATDGDGTYTYHLKMTDMAGNSVTETFTVTVDTKAPTLVVNALTGNKTYTEKDVTGIDTTASPRTATYTIAGNWTDKDGTFAGSGTNKLLRSTDGGTTWTAIDAETAAGVTINWTNAISVKESSGNSIWFKATDVAGNESAPVKFDNLTFDFSAPEITLNDATKALPAQTKDAVTIAGTVQDVLALSQDKINIVVKKDNVAQTGIEPQITQTTAGKDAPYAFTLAIPAKDDHTNDGSWTVTIDAKDDAGRDAAQQSVTVKIDTKKPVISNLDFTTGKGSKKDDVYHFNGSDIPRLTVTAADDGVGINTISYGIVSGAQTEWKDTLSLVNVNDNTDKWASLQLESGSNYRADITDFNTLGDGTYTVFVRVKDNVGNIAYSDAFVVTNDKTKPVLDEEVAAGKPKDSDGKSFDNGQTSLDGTDKGFVLSGTVTETNLKQLKLSRSVDGGTATIETLTVASGEWEVRQVVPADAVSHTYTYILTATDYAGNEVVLSRTVGIDRTAPTITIEKLNGNVIGAATPKTQNANCTFEGTVKDNDGGSGLNTVTASYDKADGTKEEVSLSIDSKGAWKQTFYDVEEGSFTLTVIAADLAGNSDTKTQAFDVDNKAPETTLSVGSGKLYRENATTVKGTEASISGTSFGDGITYITDDGFTLSGAVTDTFGFEAKNIQLSVDGPNGVGYSNENFTAKSWANGGTEWTTKDSVYNWSYTQAVNKTTHANDGLYTYRLKLTDDAGNSETKVFIVRVDTKEPNILSVSEPGSYSIQNGDEIKLGGSTSDEGVGVMKVTYTVENTTHTDKPAVTKTVTPNSGTWSETLNKDALSDGILKLTPTATDYLGNEVTLSSPVYFYKDTTAPVVGTPTISTAISTDGWHKTSTLSLSVNVTDDDTGISSVTYQVGSGEKIALTAGTTAETKNIYSSTGVVCDEGVNTITICATNKADLTETTTVTVKVDTKAAVFGENITVTKDGATASERIDVSSTGSNAAVTVSGTISETYGMASANALAVTAATKNGTPVTDLSSVISGLTTLSTGSALSSKTWSFIVLAPASHANDGKWVFTITATDVAGNTSESTATVLIDTTEPSFENQNDYQLKIGGKVYKNTNWYNATTLSVTGWFSEAATGSGIQKINYWVTASGAQRSTDPTGSAEPNRATGYTRFQTDLTDLTNGAEFAFQAVDNAGNTSGLQTRTINIDGTAPKIEPLEGESFDKPVLVNGQDNKELSLYVIDEANASGIDTTSLEVSISGTKVTSTTVTVISTEAVTTGDGTSKYKVNVTLPKETLATLSGYQPITLSVKDNAGNMTSLPVGTLNIDTTKPVASITSHSAGDSVNKKFKASGKATDANGITAITLTAKYNGNTKTYTYPASTGTEGTITYKDGSEWSVEIDTTDYMETTATDLEIAVTATDMAGNTSEEVTVKTDEEIPNKLTLSLDQNGDRPIVSLMNLTAKGGTLTSGTINGAVTDDDGQIAADKFAVSEDGTKWYTSSSDTELTYNNGSWAFTLPNLREQGGKKLYFKITDAAGTEFVIKSDAANDLGKPYVRGNTYSTVSTDVATYLDYTLDTNPPEITEYIVTKSGETEGATLMNGMVFGKANPNFTLTITAKDTSGVESISAQFGDQDPVSVDVTDSENETPVTRTLSLTVPTAETYSGTSVDILITVSDTNGAKGTLSRTVIVDNVAPTLTVKSPTKGSQIIGETEVRGNSSDGSGSGVKALGYYIPSNQEIESWTSAGVVTVPENTEFKIISDDSGNNTTSWSISFTSDSEDGSLGQFFSSEKDGETVIWHNYKSEETKTTTYGTEVIDDSGNGTEIWTLPIYFYLRDEAGNINIDTSYSLNINPDGDRPTAEFVYPSAGDYDKDAAENSLGYITLGGTIRVYGTAKDNDAVNQVSVQIQKSAYDGNGMINGNYADVDGYNEVAAVGTTSWSYSFDGTSTTIGAPGKVGETEEAGTSADGGKIYKDKTTGYLITADYFNKSRIRVRVRATDIKGIKGSWSEWIYITVDKSAPRIGSTNPLALYQYSNNDAGTGDVVASQAYESGMYISGTWWLTCSVEDESGIQSVDVQSPAVTGGSSTHVLEKGEEIEYKTAAGVSTGMKGYDIKVKLATGGTGSVKFNIYALDNSTPSQSSTASVYVRFDNEKPVQDSLKNGANTIGDGTSGSVRVTQSNYVYTINSTVGETGAGLERVAMYFKRTGSNETRIYDPRFSSENKITGYTLADNLPYKEVTATARTADSFTLDEKDAFITKGSLVKIAGVYRLIGSVTDKTYTFSPADSTLKTKIDLIYALVIDNVKVETASMSGGKLVIGNDDGDGFYDFVSDDGSSYSWKMSFDSNNIPDGPIDICYVAFDKAGNISDLGTAKTFVSNNAPRIAKVYLATDLSGNGSFDDNEIITYSMLKENSEGYTEAAEHAKIDAINNTNPNMNFTAKAKSEMRAEIVGGNNSLSYQWSAYAPSGTGWATTATATKGITSLTTTAGSVQMTVKDYNDSGKEIAATKNIVTKLATIPHSVASEKLDGISDGKVKIVYTFWDGTEETTPTGTGLAKSQFADVTAEFMVDVVDEKAPLAVIDEFYWESKDKNSLLGNSTANGHIELTTDLPTATFKDTNSGVYDLDPKVSGKISIRGSAYDETRLTEIWAHIDDFAFSEKSGDTETIETATEFGFNKDGTTATAAIGTYYKLATYANGAWTGTGADTLANGWKFEITNNDLSQFGHAVEWQLDFDTSKIDGVAGADKNIRIIAVDARTSTVKNASSETASEASAGTTRDVYNKPDYRVDVVPYVSKVYTKLAKDKKTNWSVYNRTALGHYPVQSVVSNIDTSIALNTSTSEDITLYGFNLNSSSAKIVSGTNEFTVDNTENLLKIDNSTAGQLGFNVAKLATGKLNLTVGGLPILNNINNNDAKGDASAPGSAYVNWYNRQGNGDTNNILTDDVEFDVWEFNDRAAVPINGLATGICMEVNQRTGMLNYAFANGGLYYSMGGNTDKTTAYNKTSSYSSIYWVGDYDTFAGPCVGFHVDDLGYTYSVDSGGDTNTGGSVDKWDLWTSRWGMGRRNQRGTLNDDNGNVNTFAAVRLEEIALKTGSDTMAYSLMKYRYLSAEFASTVDTSASTTNLYLVYYDALTNQIRFRAGTFSGTTRETPGGFTDQYTTGASSYYNTDNCQVIANAAAGGSFTVDGGTKKVDGIAGRGAGQYVDVAVVKNTELKDVVCVVWYDQEDNCCKFSYITDPIANWTKLKGNATALNWSEPVTVFEEGGEYCHIVSDKNNHLHIAAYAGNGDVMYAYLDSYNEYHGAEDKATVTQLPSSAVSAVDASGAVGEHLTLDVAVSENGHSIPYIGYYTAAIKRPKYAYLVDKATGFEQTAAGVDDDERYTGAWEVAVVPTPSRMTTNREDKVNVGVWKNAGDLTDSKINNAVIKSSRGGKLDGYNSTNWSKTFGNGTSNGVLGYQISTSTGSCLETAQMR